jgi:hypothetical protein
MACSGRDKNADTIAPADTGAMPMPTTEAPLQLPNADSAKGSATDTKSGTRDTTRSKTKTKTKTSAKARAY